MSSYLNKFHLSRPWRIFSFGWFGFLCYSFVTTPFHNGMDLFWHIVIGIASLNTDVFVAFIRDTFARD
jgi:hypothetical protein